jgi:hypothetical protein
LIDDAPDCGSRLVDHRGSYVLAAAYRDIDPEVDQLGVEELLQRNTPRIEFAQYIPLSRNVRVEMDGEPGWCGFVGWPVVTCPVCAATDHLDQRIRCRERSPRPAGQKLRMDVHNA